MRNDPIDWGLIISDRYSMIGKKKKKKLIRRANWMTQS